MISQAKINKTRWDFYAAFLLVFYALAQALRWRILPQSMDTYYHLLTAWGFVQAGGYSGWDFWQYAPVGRVHIYPPFFHIILSPFIAFGVNRVILAKLFEAGMPFFFISALWHFTRKNYGARMAFFVLLSAATSISFYLSLSSYLPATLAMIFGLASIDNLLENKALRGTLLLALCFYTHIGVSWFFAATLLFWGLLERRYLKQRLFILILAAMLSLPVIFKQLVNLKYISLSGINQGYFCEFKIIEYALALFALSIALKRPKAHSLFLAFFLSSFIFILYPYRLFSAQGYLPIVFLLAALMDFLSLRLENKTLGVKSLFVCLLAAIILLSPTLLMEKPDDKSNRVNYKLYIFDSVFVDTLLPGRNRRPATGEIWIPGAYLPIVDLIRLNTQQDSIIYATLHNVGMCLASISGRATANSLLPEIGPARSINPFLVARIIVFLNDDEPGWVRSQVERYRLNKIGQNKLFTVYDNPSSGARIEVKKASVSFGFIVGVILAFLALFFFPKRGQNQFSISRFSKK